MYLVHSVLQNLLDDSMEEGEITSEVLCFLCILYTCGAGGS